MNKRYFLIALSALLLCSCGTNNSPEPNGSESVSESVTDASSVSDLADPDASDPDETKSDEDQTQPLEDKNVTYQVYTKTERAEDVYQTRMIDLPEKINDHDYYPCGIYDNKIQVVIPLETNDTYEYGFVNCDTKEYKQVIPSIANGYIHCSDNQYYVLGTSRNDDTLFLQIYNAETNEYKTIFNFIDDNQPTNNNAVLCSGKVYFDCTSMKSGGQTLYEYDIASDELKTVSEHAHSPMTAGGEVWYVNYDPDTVTIDKIVNPVSGDEIAIKNNHLTRVTCTDHRIFGITSAEAFDKYNSTQAIAELKADGKDAPFVATRAGEGEFFDTLVSNDFCIAWGDNTGCDSTPCVYDIATDTLVYFDTIGNCYYSPYLCKGQGMLFDNMNFSTKHQVCIFEPKEN